MDQQTKEQILVSSMEVAKAAIEIKARSVRRQFHRVASKGVHDRLVEQTEGNMVGVLRPLLKKQVASIVAGLRSRAKAEDMLRTKSAGRESPIAVDLPFIRQENGSFCGPACLLSVLRFFGVDHQTKGGLESGNFEHAGRPGVVGRSAPRDGDE